MSEEIITTEEVTEDVTRKEVAINVIINGIRYSGAAVITENDNGSCTVDVSNICNDRDILRSDAYCDDVALCSIESLLECEALYQGGFAEEEDIETCGVTGYHYYLDSMTWVDYEECYAFTDLTYYFDYWNKVVLYGSCSERKVRDFDGDIIDYFAPDAWFEERYYCDECECYIMDDNDYVGVGMCQWCAESYGDGIIEDYGVSHNHAPILFGNYKDEESFIGLGFELEVDCTSSNRRNNGKTARGLCEACGLAEDEMRYAHDGSLDYGFECISQPHTIKAFWDKRESWEKMLKYLLDNGYRSHDPGTCGLHVHVSRGMFGTNKKDQDTAISKIYTFFDDNWEDIVKVSRRSNFHYCSKNMLTGAEYEYVENGITTKYDCWKKRSKLQGGHSVALNNANHDTFEYRLGRGTLNAWSFFAWIDFVLTITKNAKRITIGKVESNDRLSWLGGVSESTARYIYKRGAFQKEMVALYPSIEWENNVDDNN